MKTDPKPLNPDFARFCKVAREEREAVFTSVADTKKASAVAIEKDFFVCRVLDAGKLEISGAVRKSRHHYDVALIGPTDIGRAAIADKDLAEKVRVALRAADDAKPGALRLVPPRLY